MYVLRKEYIMKTNNQDLELVCVLEAISEVAEKLAKKEEEKLAKKEEEKLDANKDKNNALNCSFQRLSEAASIMSECARLGLSDNVMICVLKARGLLSEDEFEALSRF